MNNKNANSILVDNIRQTLQEARKNIAHSVNATLVRAYWQVGKHTVEYEQGGAERAEYGKNVINSVSKQLVAEFGSGFTPTNLRYMRQFYLCFPIYHTLCDKLSWSHCRTLLKVQNSDTMKWYLSECVQENWSVRQLDRQINTLFYERMLASRDKETVKKENEHGSSLYGRQWKKYTHLARHDTQETAEEVR